ncbi:MAG: hypothetical protein IH591_06515, partial [Bacteroidales bacterium]|nr:hypothetical protein [Bacteroidales bacterium]
MDTGSESASFLEVLLFLFATGIAIYIRIIFIFRPYGNRLVPGYLYLRKLESRYTPSLERYFPFYNALSDKKKRHFEKRVQKFIDIKQFIP